MLNLQVCCAENIRLGIIGEAVRSVTGPSQGGHCVACTEVLLFRKFQFNILSFAINQSAIILNPQPISVRTNG